MLSDLFWMGRYAERAENMARLLTVTRERYHEYRYRREMEGSECVPVLLTALGPDHRNRHRQPAATTPRWSRRHRPRCGR